MIVDNLTVNNEYFARKSGDVMDRRKFLVVRLIFGLLLTSATIDFGDSEARADNADDLPFISPRNPAESLKQFRIHAGFRIELSASEPDLASPVALDFDEDGRLYVAEFLEFNQRDSKQAHGRGRIRLLTDTKGNGVYDKSSIFLDNVDWPTAVCCYDGGVFVGAAPNILYAKDSDGDGKADVRRIVFTGFARDNVGGEALFNSFRWGLDNRIHVQTSTAGGAVRHMDKKDARPVSVRGQRFLFDPRTEAFEITSGGGQFGMSMDDWGRTFVCTSHDPAFLIMYDGRYLARNPYLEAPAAAMRISPGGYDTKVARISPNEPWRVARTRLRTTGIEPPHPTEGAEPSGYFSAACGVTIYRGDAWPAQYHGNLFVGEVSNNLVYRARLEPDGVVLKALRADEGPEFLASPDIWFRPVQFANGPDGALYVLDMYRYLVEATETIPPSIVKHLNVGAGFDKGRLYRIVPDGFKRPGPPRLGQATTVQLAALLEHSNGWHRDTAARLLYQRQDKTAVAPLKQMAAGSKSPRGRMHALYALDGLKSLDVDTVLRALGDTDSRVREHALRMAEAFATDPQIRARMADMTDDRDVRYQLAFSLGAVPGDAALAALATLARRDGSDSWCRLAVLSSVNSRAAELFRLLLQDTDYRKSAPGQEMLGTLASLVGSASRKTEVNALIRSLDALPASEDWLAGEMVRAMALKLPASSRNLLSDGKAGAILSKMTTQAVRTAPDERQTVADRLAAIRMLRLAAFSDVKDLAPKLLSFRQPQRLQTAFIDTLARFNDSAAPTLLLDSWPGLSPPVRASAVEACFSRPAWLNSFLDAVEKGTVNRGDVEPARIQTLQTHPDNALRNRAAAIFSSTRPARRQDVIAAYQKALKIAGDRKRGKEVFKKACSAWHQLEGVGTRVGAELNGIRDQGMATVMLNILDPNREVKPQFLSYHLVTDSGRLITGMITAEAANSITIRRADGSMETILRVHIEELRSTGLSFMPEGLEQVIDVPAMADLLTYLNSIK